MDNQENYSDQIVTVSINNLLPTITGPSGGAGANSSSKSINENTKTVHTFSANKTVTWSLNGGADASKFNIDSNGALTFKSAPDYENPSDTGTNNSYEVKIRATDSAGNTSDQNLTVNISDVDDYIYKLKKF